MVGHSLGGIAALNHPERVGSRIIFAPLPQPRDSAASAFNTMAIPAAALQRFVSLRFAASMELLIFDRSAEAVMTSETMPVNFSKKGDSLRSIRPKGLFVADSDMVVIRNALPEMIPRCFPLGRQTDILFGKSGPVLRPDMQGCDAGQGAIPAPIKEGHIFVCQHLGDLADRIPAQDVQREKNGAIK